MTSQNRLVAYLIMLLNIGLHAEEQVSLIGAEQRHKYLHRAHFWISPGIPKSSVIAFLGKADFENAQSLVYFWNNGETEYCAKIRLNAEGNVKDVRTFEMRLQGVSSDVYKEKSEQIRKEKKENHKN